MLAAAAQCGTLSSQLLLNRVYMKFQPSDTVAIDSHDTQLMLKYI